MPKAVSTKPAISRRKSVAALSNSRWAAYATAGAATALTGIGSAEADVHYSGPINQVLNAGYSLSARATFTLDNGGAIRFLHYGPSSRATSGGFAGFRIQGAAVSNQFRGIAAGNTGQFRYPSKLAFGDNISVGAFVPHNANLFGTLAAGAGFANSQFKSVGTGFIGFKFDGGSGSEFGWARVIMTGTPGNGFTVVDYAWADPGTPITAGQTAAAVPEPGSLGLLAVGATGLLLWRKRRAQASASRQS